MAEIKSKPDAPPVEKAAVFTKEQILSSKKYRAQRDLLSAVLEGTKPYTHGDVKQIIEEFMKGEVN